MVSRVVHVTDYYLPRLGGIEMHVGDLVAHQRSTGVEASVVTGTAAGPAADPAWVQRLGSRLSPLAADEALSQLLRTSAPDVVHVHVSVWSPLAMIAARRAAQLGVPTLVTVHSLWSAYGPLPTLAQALLRLRHRPLHWSAVSDRAAQPLRAMLGPGVPVDVLPNAVDVPSWRVTPREPDVPTVVSVMRLARTKRPLPLARMLREVRRRLPAEQPLRAVVIGEGPLRPGLERYLDRHHMRDWVELPGRLDRAAIRDRLASASVFVAPAELESFGIAALEARCVGLPVVASSRSGVGEFITPGVDGLLSPSDAGMVDDLTRLLTDPVLRTAITRHNRTVAPDFGWAAAGARTLEVYARAALVADARTPGAPALPESPVHP